MFVAYGDTHKGVRCSYTVAPQNTYTRRASSMCYTVRCAVCGETHYAQWVIRTSVWHAKLSGWLEHHETFEVCSIICADAHEALFHIGVEGAL